MEKGKTGHIFWVSLSYFDCVPGKTKESLYQQMKLAIYLPVNTLKQVK